MGSARGGIRGRGAARGRGMNFRGRGNGINGVSKFRSHGIGKPPPLSGRHGPILPPHGIPPPRMRPGAPPLPPPRPMMRGPEYMPPPHPEVMRPRLPPPFPPHGRPLPPPGFAPPRPQLPPHLPPPALLRGRPPIGPPSRGMRPIHPMMRPMNKSFSRPIGGKGMMAGKRGGRVMKKGKKANTNPDEAELSKPWVNESLKAEILKKLELYQKAKQSNAEADWTEFKSQKSKVVTMLQAAKLEYIGNHPEQVEDCYCETCDRSFYSACDYQNHVAEHEVCGVDGCEFVAHPKIVDMHIKYQHDTGLYEKIKNVDTPEKIEKWIEERKKNFPTKENIKKRQAENEEKMKRGERIQRDTGKLNSATRGRGGFMQRGRQAKFPPKFVGVRNTIEQKRRLLQKYRKVGVLHRRKTKWLHEEEFEAETLGPGGMIPFAGTAKYAFCNPEHSTEKQISDEEWECSSVKSDKPIQPFFCSALTNLMNCYATGSSDSEDEQCKNQLSTPINSLKTSSAETKPLNKNISEENISENISEKSVSENIPGQSQLQETQITNEQKTEDNNDSGPEEVPLIKNCNNIIAPVVQSTTMDKEGRKEQGRKRKRRHHKNANSKKKDLPKENPKYKDIADNRPKRAPTFLEMLLKDQIIRERNIILQCVRYVVENKFFGVGLQMPSVDSSSPLPKQLDSSKMNILKCCIKYVVNNNFFSSSNHIKE